MSDLSLLALCGSLRNPSYNRSTLEALQLLAPAEVLIQLDTTIGTLPLFNPDLEGNLPISVKVLRQSIGNAQGIIIASPEYAHGISGVLKNALDWLVSGTEFIDKPILIINTSPRASHALLALKEILKTMSGKVIDSATITLPLLGSGYSTQDIIKNVVMREILELGLQQFIQAIKAE